MVYPADDVDPAQNYPNASLVVKLKSKCLPHKLVEFLIKKSEGTVKKLVTEGKPQVVPVFDFLKNIMTNNNLIPVWSEMPALKEVLRLQGENKDMLDEMKLFEKAGKIKMKLRQRKFYLDVEFVIPEAYPYAQLEIKFLDHNYDPNFARLFFARAEEIIRRLW